MRHLPVSLLLILASLGLASPAFAQDPTWHIGIGVATEYDQRGPYDFSADAEDARSIFGGIGFDNGFGAELAYVDLGHLLAPGVVDAGFSLDGTLWSLAATYMIRMESLAPYAKLGWFSRDEDGISIGIAGPRPLSIDDDGLMAEVGLRWHLTDPLALRLGYVWYDFDTGSEGSAQLAAEWRF
jgi:hypothetical protein